MRPGYRTDLVLLLEQEYLPKLERLSERLRIEFPRWKFVTYSQSVGSLTDFQGQDIGIDCLLSGGPPDKPDNVALEVTFAYLDKTPRVMADVCWGHPHGYVEASLDWPGRTSVEWPMLDAASLLELDAGLPTLFNALRCAIARGAPPTQP